MVGVGKVNYIGFNQDNDCFAVGLDLGFKVFNCDPFKEKMRQEFTDGGIGHVEMLFRCNYLAIVGGGRNPKYPPNKVLIWDDLKNKCVIELEFRSVVKSVRLRRDRIVVVLLNKIFVYGFTHAPQKLFVFETADNEGGVSSLCSSNTNALLAFPGRQRGHLQLVDITDGKSSSIIPAHNASLSCIAFNLEGSRVATSSEKGTLIRVFDTDSGKLLNELRRGSDRAEIYSIAFNKESTQLCVSSDKSTIHIFNLRDNDMLMQVEESNKGISFIKDLLPKYFSSQWSFAQFRIERSEDTRLICAFGSGKNSIIAICIDGSIYKYIYDARKGGECFREAYNKFVEE